MIATLGTHERTDEAGRPPAASRVPDGATARAGAAPLCICEYVERDAAEVALTLLDSEAEDLLAAALRDTVGDEAGVEVLRREVPGAGVARQRFRWSVRGRTGSASLTVIPVHEGSAPYTELLLRFDLLDVAGESPIDRAQLARDARDALSALVRALGGQANERSTTP